MTDQRIIDLRIDAVTLTEISNACGGNKQLFLALGYLIQWNMSFGHVTITGYVDEDCPEMTAVYRREAGGDVGYVIGAIWHGDHFGFHS